MVYIQCAHQNTSHGLYTVANQNKSHGLYSVSTKIRPVVRVEDCDATVRYEADIHVGCSNVI